MDLGDRDDGSAASDPTARRARRRERLRRRLIAFTAIATAASSTPDEVADVSGWRGRTSALVAVSVMVVWTAIATGVFFVVRRPVFGLVERLLYVASFAWLALAVVDVMLVRG